MTKIFKWKKNRNTVQNPCYKFGNPCPCGCSSKYYFYIFDGKEGITLQFDSKKELEKFRNECEIKEPKIFNPSNRVNLIWAWRKDE